MTKKLQTIISESLKRVNDNVSKRDIYYLLKETFSVDETEMMLHPEKEHDDSEFQKRLDKLLEGMPVEYVLGYAPFCGLNFRVTGETLIPRNETEELVSHVSDYLKEMNLNHPEIIDIGSGSGCIAITLARNYPEAEIVSVDISDGALKIARENNAALGTNVKFLRSDCFDNVEQRKFDVIVSNPPYIDKDTYVQESVLKYEPHTALFADNHGLAVVEKILSQAGKYAADQCLLAFEISPEQESSLIQLAGHYLPDFRCSFQRDMNDNLRFFFLRR